MAKKTSAIDKLLVDLEKGLPVPPELLTLARAEFERVKRVIGNTREMRSVQKRYYEKFAQSDLIEAKKLEKETDKALDALWAPVETVKQESLFPEENHA